MVRRVSTLAAALTLLASPAAALTITYEVTVLDEHNVASTQPVTVTIQGHRWERGPHYTNIEFLPPGMGATLDILSGSAEGGGGPGEWLITGRAGNLLVRASFVTTAGGALELQSA